VKVGGTGLSVVSEDMAGFIFWVVDTGFFCDLAGFDGF
jgi:hypothetical protein